MRDRVVGEFEVVVVGVSAMEQPPFSVADRHAAVPCGVPAERHEAQVDSESLQGQ
jgi:hypothetical protein